MWTKLQPGLCRRTSRVFGLFPIRLRYGDVPFSCACTPCCSSKGRGAYQLAAMLIGVSPLPHNNPSLCCHATSQVEVLLYLSPMHHRDFVASMAYNLNDAYRRFMRRNPTFKARRVAI